MPYKNSRNILLSPYAGKKNLYLSEELLPTTTLNSITLDGNGRFVTVAVNSKDYTMFHEGQVGMAVHVEMPSNAALTAADTIEMLIYSGKEVDGNNKIVSPAVIPFIVTNPDFYLNKRLNATDTMTHSDAMSENIVADEDGLLKIQKISFDYEGPTKVSVEKLITFPRNNSSVTAGNQYSQNAHTALDNFYSIAIKPTGVFINNADVKVTIRFFKFNVDVARLQEFIQTLARI